MVGKEKGQRLEEGEWKEKGKRGVGGQENRLHADLGNYY